MRSGSLRHSGLQAGIHLVRADATSDSAIATSLKRGNPRHHLLLRKFRSNCSRGRRFGPSFPQKRESIFLLSSLLQDTCMPAHNQGRNRKIPSPSRRPLHNSVIPAKAGIQWGVWVDRDCCREAVIHPQPDLPSSRGKGFRNGFISRERARVRVNPRQQRPGPFALSNYAGVAKEGNAPAQPRIRCNRHENWPHSHPSFPRKRESIFSKQIAPTRRETSPRATTYPLQLLRESAAFLSVFPAKAGIHLLQANSPCLSKDKPPRYHVPAAIATKVGHNSFRLSRFRGNPSSLRLKDIHQTKKPRSAGAGLHLPTYLQLRQVLHGRASPALSAVSNDCPHEHDCSALGLRIVKPPPIKAVLKSISEPLRYIRLNGSTKTRTPPSSTTSSPSSARSSMDMPY